MGIPGPVNQPFSIENHHHAPIPVWSLKKGMTGGGQHASSYSNGASPRAARPAISGPVRSVSGKPRHRRGRLATAFPPRRLPLTAHRPARTDRSIGRGTLGQSLPEPALRGRDGGAGHFPRNHRHDRRPGESGGIRIEGPSEGVDRFLSRALCAEASRGRRAASERLAKRAGA